jgi:predicted Zn-dependent peptidase
VEKERPVVFQEISMVEDNPEEYIHILSGSAFWGENPLGRSILGTRENIVRFTSENIISFFRRFYQPDRIVISAAGDLDHNHFVDLVGPAFDSVKCGPTLPDRVTPRARSLIDLHPRELEQIHICLGTRGLSITDPKRYAFSLMNTILGGNMSSRLFQEIRERRGLAYSVYSFISSYVDTGMFGVYVGVDPLKATEAIEIILKEIRKLTQTEVDPVELYDAQEYTKGSLLLAAENSENQMVRLAQNEIHFGKYVPLEEVLDKIEAVTVEDILSLARELFEPEQIALTTLGPVKDRLAFEEILAA